MNVLVSGGFGFLGGRLAQYLSSTLGDRIVLGSRLAALPPAWLPQATVRQMQWDTVAGLEPVCAAVDAVVHLAAMNAQECAADPVAALAFNGVATARLVDVAVRQGVKRFIYLSTAHVYGAPLTGPITEATCPNPAHPYATSHRTAEDVVRVAGRQEQMATLIVRLSNAYGAPAHRAANCWMLLANDLCRQAVTTRRMVLRSSGLQRRDWIPVGEACRAIGHLLHAPPCSDEVVNVGGEWSPSVWEFACLIREGAARVLGYSPELTRGPARADDNDTPVEYRLDALRRTGFRVSTDKTSEIDRLLDFCRTAFT